MSIAVDVVAVGARTALGLRADASAAAYRAGLSAVREHPFMIDRVGDPMVGALDGQLDPELVGPTRLAALAETALHEAAAAIGEQRGAKLPVFVALPEIRPGFSEKDAEIVRSAIHDVVQVRGGVQDVELIPHGHAAGMKALALAVERIQSGTAEVCLVGGVDSYFHPDTLEWLDLNRQLLSADARSAFVPGEGAGFCVLMSERTRIRLGLEAAVRISAVGFGVETQLIKTADVCLGVGLTTAVREAIAGLTLPGETINQVICDVNGERYRGEEWGFVCLRLPEHFDDPAAYSAPADSWGDVGAASGLLFTMLACQAVERGYAEGSRTLVWASSEGGLRGAVLLTAVEKN